MTTYFYKYPFAITGTKTAIPPTSASDPNVNYQHGYTASYELVYPSDPAALPIERDKFNQLVYDITNNLQEYQTQGTPNWITSADNGGSPYSYPIYAHVLYNAGSGNQLWENQVAGNTTAPGVDSTWVLITASALANPPGTVIDFAGPVAPAGYFPCDGTTKSRSTNANLFNAITQVQNGTTTIGVNTLTGLSDTTQMYIGQKIEGAGINASTSVASIVTGTSITMSSNATASATVPVRFFSFENGDGTTTFTLPDSRGYVYAGQGGQTNLGITANSTAVGQSGGAASVVLTPSNMPAGVPTTSSPITFDYVQLGTSSSKRAPEVTFNQTWAPGGAVATPIVQPTQIMMKCIKY